jgi:mono/diheme cytochrome c family protein
VQNFVKRSLCATFLLVYIFSAVGHAREREPQRGKILLERMCGRCHAVGTTGRSPHGAAPPFRTFSDETLYDENFVQRLHKGLLTGHRDMPTFRFNWDDATDAVNYLKSIQEHRKSK